MSKPFRDPELTLVFGRQIHADPLTKGGGAFANINRDIKYLANDTAHQLALSMRGQLIVQPTQHALAGFGVIVLDERHATANGLFEFLLIKAFKEKPTFIAKNLGLDNFYVGDFSVDDVHFFSGIGIRELGVRNRN